MHVGCVGQTRVSAVGADIGVGAPTASASVWRAVAVTVDSGPTGAAAAPAASDLRLTAMAAALAAPGRRCIRGQVAGLRRSPRSLLSVMGCELA